MISGISELAVVITIAAFLGVLAKLFRQPLILAYLATGALIGAGSKLEVLSIPQLGDGEMFQLFAVFGWLGGELQIGAACRQSFISGRAFADSFYVCYWVRHRIVSRFFGDRSCVYFYSAYVLKYHYRRKTAFRKKTNKQPLWENQHRASAGAGFCRYFYFNGARRHAGRRSICVFGRGFKNSYRCFAFCNNALAWKERFSLFI